MNTVITVNRMGQQK